MFAMLLSGVVLGYELGIFPVVIPVIHSVFQVNFDSISIITAVLPIAAAFAAVISGTLSDSIGRRSIVLLGAVCILFGTLECSIAESIYEFVFGRIVIGCGVGIMAVILPLYLVEVAPAQRRGGWVAIYFLSVNVGIFLSCLIGSIFVYLDSWRSVFMLGAIPGMALFIIGLLLPESPRWLIMAGQQGQAGQALIKLFGSKKAMSIISAMDAMDHRTIYKPTSLLSHQGLRIVLLGLLINIFAQAVGIHAVVAYATVVLQKIRVNDRYIDLFSNILISFILMVSAMLCARVIDSLSRRKLLLLGMTGMVTSLVIITWALHNINSDDFMTVILLFGCVFFVGAQGFSIGPIASLLPAEIFPQTLRGKGMGISIAAYWITNTIIVYAFPRLLMGYGANLAFVIFLIFAIIAWVWVYYNIPETNQIALELLEKNLQQGRDNRDLGMHEEMPEWRTV
jgi:SP family galactose:H+ symporter-like MFS transporter